MSSLFPSWNALHPLVVHFPIALLIVTPLLIIAGLVFQSNRRAFLLSALLLMVIGTVACYVATMTGEAGEEGITRTGVVKSVLDEHQALGETVRNMFTVLTVIYALLLFAPRFFRMQIPAGQFTIFSIIFLILYATGILFLADAAHEGGRLVHEFDVRANLTGSLPGQEQPVSEIRIGDSLEKKNFEPGR